MTKYLKLRPLFMVVVATSLPLCHQAPASTDYLPFNVSIAVLSEEGALLPGAEVSLDAYLPEVERTDGQRFSRQLKTSKASGPLHFRGRCLDRIIIRVNKPGYFTSWRQYRFQINYAENRYEPWGLKLSIVLKHQSNPRPLFVHHVDWLVVPALDRPIGFDLEQADWVPPYGSGQHSDFVFRLSRELGEGEIYAGTMEVTFSNPMDGIQPLTPANENKTTLLLGQEAPLDGYRPAFARDVGVQQVDGELKRVDDPPFTEIGAFEGMWFRVRSEIDESTGELKRARYGKLDGFIDFEVRRRDVGAKVAFAYYLSPDHSRSVEWNGESLVDHPELQMITKF